MNSQICVLDMKRKDDWKKKSVEYDVDKMLCLEIEMKMKDGKL